MAKVDDDTVFKMDAGFGDRLTVSVCDSKENGGGGFVQFYDVDRNAMISIDFDIYDRITKAVAQRREA